MCDCYAALSAVSLVESKFFLHCLPRSCEHAMMEHDVLAALVLVDGIDVGVPA